LRDGKCCGKKALVESDEQPEANVDNVPRWHTLKHSQSKDGCAALPSPCAPCSPWLISYSYNRATLIKVAYRSSSQ
jgi:hypothetical protein